LNFIEQYKIDTYICDDMIQYYKKNTEYKAKGVSLGSKDSTDVYFYTGTTNENLNNFFKQLNNCLKQYVSKYNITNNLRIHMCNNIQHYEISKGYPGLHYERDKEVSTRQLVYMLYLNTVTDKGGTEFPFQNITTSAVKGNLVIWPADFTHPHRGIISDTQEKYIATGWIKIA